ncbi:Protein maternal effect lethal 26 [Araneus ventricosus]|uniref:Protein maternal effect lethal 26 n=1 Tax=Araneus ventricosus TaxID=182803 RepID=A0A4Y2UTE9_ARAVE|nr:Protein maternal effect lethal 26 [Araneus ventricosus]
MASEAEEKGKGFVFEWKIKNFSYCWHKKGDFLESPSFVVDSLEGTKWKLSLFPRGHTDGNYIGLYLKRDPNCNGPNAGMSIEVELSILSWNTFTSDHTMKNSATLTKGANFGYPAFEKRKDIFMLNKHVFLPEDTLAIRCKMCKSDGKSLTDEKCSATTHITVGRRSFLWPIEKFSTLEPDKENTICVRSASDDRLIMSLNLSLTGGQNFDEIFQVQMTTPIPNIFCTTIFSLLNTSGDKEECGRCEFWFDRVCKTRHMTLLLTKERLMAKRSQYLPNDVLTLQCECAYSTGNAFEEGEKVGPGCVNVEIPQLTYSLHSGDNSSLSVEALEEDLQWLYTDGFLSDVKLKTNSKIFPAHKIILSTRSPVFKAMFTSNMKEKSSKIVDIEDMDDDTVHRMLFYIYTADVEDLQWEGALKLYVAADKYEILTLKMKCSAYIAANLNPNNACDALVLADLHQDVKLKSTVQKFILRNDQVIINSKNWECLMENNLKLATDTFSPGNEGKIGEKNGVVLKFGTVVGISALNNILKVPDRGGYAGGYRGV